MISKLSEPPNWTYYDNSATYTQRLQKYWESAAVGGGTLMKDLNGIYFPDDTLKFIKVPLLQTIRETDTFGYFHIKKIAFSANAAYYYDVWILSTNRADAPTLEAWATDSKFQEKTKCCWNTGLEISKKLNGFARVIQYNDENSGGARPATTFQLWEGQVKYG